MSLYSQIYEAGWRVVHHAHLPEWMKDNEYLHHGHRPELRSFTECFKSVFRIHTETGNIWTHLLGLSGHVFCYHWLGANFNFESFHRLASFAGMVAFIGITGYFLSRPLQEVHWQEKAVFSAFFFGAIVCLGFSWVFHTVCCHSSTVGKFFNK